MSISAYLCPKDFKVGDSINLIFSRVTWKDEGSLTRKFHGKNQSECIERIVSVKTKADGVEIETSDDEAA
jgi:hypothetical protein